MMDGRRHSVDIPISKTLVALRRVRSLRDPSTNSITKQHSSLIDNLHWENSNSSRISLLLPDFANDCDFDDNVAFRSRNLGFERQREHDATDSGNESPSESCGSNHGGHELDFPCILPPVNNNINNNFKVREPSYLANAKSSQLGRTDPFNPAIKPQRKNRVKPSEIAAGISSHLGSPYLSVGDICPPHGSSTHIDQDFDVLDNSDNGCGISFCWSKSPRFRESSNLYYEMEDRPLILHRADDTDIGGHRSMRHNGGEISPNAETPRSLSMKFRPKSFGDLVGQDVVVRSLLGAVSSGRRITPFYLFHGPRGTGKTSASRIFAAALNCLPVKEKRPCGLCRECVSSFSGRSKDVKEVDSVKINRADQVKSLVKNACSPQVSSRFKIFIIDECQLLNVETWVTLITLSFKDRAKPPQEMEKREERIFLTEFH